MTISLNGIGVVRGIAIGKAHILDRRLVEIPEYVLPRQYIDDEVLRFNNAVETARFQLKSIKKHIPAYAPADVSSFIDTHLLMLSDSALVEAPIKLIQEMQYNAEWALRHQRDILAQVFNEMDDPYLRTRRDDIDHVVNRILRVLLKHPDHHAESVENRLKGTIILADDLSPADTVLMLHQGIQGFVTEFGGPTSHTAIIARGLGIPAIVGLHGVQKFIKEDDEIIIDGVNGVLISQPDEVIKKHYRRQQRNQRRYQAELKQLIGKRTGTQDRVKISLMANIELPEDVNAARKVSAEGVGLYRTEFLYMNRKDTPDEEEQLRSYVRVVNALKGLPVTIRTLDLGADKQVDSAPGNRPAATNPALGLRAVRLCLKEPELFLTQLRAIMRAAAYGPVKIMIPMLTTIAELMQVKDFMHEAQRQLRQTRKKYNADIPLGGMIEIPAAAIAADSFAQNLDFLSIGTNDLIQYTLAIDRIDDEVNYLYDPAHPSVLSLIQNVIQAGEKADIPVSMCGEMAGDIRYTQLLLGLGLREFSMHPATLLEIKKIINTSDMGKLKKVYSRLVRQADQQQIHNQLELDLQQLNNFVH
jgi:phosphotransferase system enzyme I (PtsI)